MTPIPDFTVGFNSSNEQNYGGNESKKYNLNSFMTEVPIL